METSLKLLADSAGGAKLFILLLRSGLQMSHWGSIEGILVLSALAASFIFIGLWALSKTLKFVADIKEHGDRLGIKFSRTSPSDEILIQRRKRFCLALQSDLQVIAKAENWNDQHFTDIDAEVAGDAQYYSSPINRLFGRRSRGLRQFSSLQKFFNNSTDQFIFLIGEPGSGKSVALRHLASKLTKRGTYSNDQAARIPLYINLRELKRRPHIEINADLIKDFVLDNIRRGDSDTVDYVREHWNKFKEDGTWVFLFDSFDEIPEVLHSPSESAVAAQYAEAIRQFLSGMSSCKGIVASRQYRCPNHVPWPRMFLSPLSHDRRMELVANFFLDDKKRAVARDFLAKTNLSGNPMFMSLLCRYIKETSSAPPNDYDLLSRHLTRLAQRDEDYLRRRFSLTPDAIMAGAIKLAALLAENPNLGLSPTFVELQGHLISEPNIPNPEKFLSALIEIKIGRSDSSESGDNRRFAFAHRRYQEALYTRRISERINLSSPEFLLCGAQQREFHVALLQTAPPASIASICNDAVCVLESLARKLAPTRIPSSVSLNQYFLKVEDSDFYHALSILANGLSNRRAHLDPSVFGRIDVVLDAIWEESDFLSRGKLLELSGLCSETAIKKRIDFAISIGTTNMQRDALNLIPLLTSPDESYGKWFFRRLADNILNSQGEEELLRHEALIRRLPNQIGADQMFNRCKLIRQVLHLPIRFQHKLLEIIDASDGSAFSKSLAFTLAPKLPEFIKTACLAPIAILLVRLNSPMEIPAPLIGILSTLCALGVILMVLYRHRGTPSHLTLLALIDGFRPAHFKDWIRTNWRRSLFTLIFMAVLLSPAIGAFNISLHLKFSRSTSELIAAVSELVFLLLVVSLIVSVETRAEAGYKVRLEELKQSTSGPLGPHARSLRELISWMKLDFMSVFSSDDEARGISKMALMENATSEVLGSWKFILNSQSKRENHVFHCEIAHYASLKRAPANVSI